MIQQANRRPRDRAMIVVSGDDVYEDMFSASLRLQDILVGAGLAARAVMGTAALAKAADADLVVLYTALGDFPARAQAALASAVAAGTGLLAVHSASVFPARAPDADGVADSHRVVARLIGARYLSHGPAPHQSRFRVLTDQQHPVTGGLTPFEVAHEHYQLETGPDAEVIAWREASTSGAWPATEAICCVRTEGSGRVCYLQLGHDMRVWDEPGVRDLVVRAARWACRQLPAVEAR